jgi:hypothetical protein
MQALVVLVMGFRGHNGQDQDSGTDIGGESFGEKRTWFDLTGRRGEDVV